MAIYKKILVGSLLVLTVCFIGGCKKEKEKEFPKDKQGYPKYDVALINGKQYPLSGTETEVKVSEGNGTIDVILPQYLPTHFWSVEEKASTDIVNYSKRVLPVDKETEGQISSIQTFCLHGAANDSILFKWSNITECGKAFAEKEPDYLLKIKIVK